MSPHRVSARLQKLPTLKDIITDDRTRKNITHRSVECVLISLTEDEATRLNQYGLTVVKVPTELPLEGANM